MLKTKTIEDPEREENNFLGIPIVRKKQKASNQFLSIGTSNSYNIQVEHGENSTTGTERDHRQLGPSITDRFSPLKPVSKTNRLIKVASQKIHPLKERNNHQNTNPLLVQSKSNDQFEKILNNTPDSMKNEISSSVLKQIEEENVENYNEEINAKIKNRGGFRRKTIPPIVKMTNLVKISETNEELLPKLIVIKEVKEPILKLCPKVVLPSIYKHITKEAAMESVLKKTFLKPTKMRKIKQDFCWAFCL